MNNTTRPNNTAQYFGKDLEVMSFAQNYHRWILNEFLPYIGNHVAEVGAGVGSFSRLILETDITRLTAFEPSDNMFPLLQKALNHDKRVTTINCLFDQRNSADLFDAVAYVNVLEHIEDDIGELAVARDAITSGGHLLIFVPALPWLYSDLDKQVGHFRRYTKNNLVGMVERAGFSLVKTRYFDIAGVIPWYINFTLLKNPITQGGVALYDKSIVPIMRIIEGIVPPPIGKNILLVAKKI